jgi:hypothetical protein
VLTAYNLEISVSIEEIIFKETQGKLYVAETDALLVMLRRTFSRDLALPKNAIGLGRRLRSAHFRGLKFLDEDSAPQLAQLKRTASKRPIGFFVADDPSGESGTADSSDRP